MMKGHVHKLIQGWLSEFTDLRERLNAGGCSSGCSLLALLDELEARVRVAGRPYPMARPCDRKVLAAARDAAKRAAIEEQEREASALAEVEQAAAAAAGQGVGAAAATVVQQHGPAAAPEQHQQKQQEGEPAAKRPCMEAVPVLVG
jgi:hypothetical protein